ncbi:uncharacterized protein LOC132796551 [Drosophila nasuta]|uniref:uncharacterized protein LOC132796551 n=1 Tax=Drosophila nasuta TaxID=42062 RepID=UPI00295EEA3B|nr:uncharacterized protein LOC132796551 [Drosophila nasuta]
MRFYLLIALALTVLMQLVAGNAALHEGTRTPLHAIAQRDTAGVAGTPPSGGPPHGGPPPPRTTTASSG